MKFKREDLPHEWQEIEKAIGMQAVVSLIQNFSGQKIYVCSQTTIKRNAQSRKLKKAFNGLNHKELAKRFGLSTSTVRRRLSKVPMNHSARHF
ncbi:hypothetical protein GMMP15_260010 [Candidatus Magnetomoraceae bacterium gMMP-15]